MGSQGLIGKALHDKIVEEGATCISADSKLETNLEQGHISLDITDEESINHAVALVYERYGRIDGVVNTAYPRTPDWGKKFEDISTASWQKNVDMQLNSSFVLSQRILERMKLVNAGSFVSLSSIYGVVGPDFNVYKGLDMTMPAAYSAIKGGLINFTKYLASYYGRYNLRVNCVSPGGIFDSQNPLFVENYEQRVPMRRMGTPADIAGPVCFLLSDESAYITGHNLIVDGGWTSI